jgi:hypothetical protein
MGGHPHDDRERRGRGQARDDVGGRRPIQGRAEQAMFRLRPGRGRGLFHVILGPSEIVLPEDRSGPSRDGRRVGKQNVSFH